MQSDEKLDASFLRTKSWESKPETGQSAKDVNRFRLPSLERSKLSFSGNERNHLFQNLQGGAFRDISGISGLDSIQDGRTFAVWDYDRDGWQDLALLNINTPVLSLFRNQLGEIDNGNLNPRNMIALKVVGGNRTALPSAEFSSRDGVGAKVTIALPDQTLVRQSRCGEGLAAQNSRLLFFGIGENNSVESIQVRWPSGVIQRVANVDAGSLVTVFENTTESADGTGFDLSRYLVDVKLPQQRANDFASTTDFSVPNRPDAKFTIYTSVATWCPNCRKQISQLRLLRDNFTDQQLGMVGVPVDASDSLIKLQNYVAENRPPYDLTSPWDTSQRKSFNQAIEAKFGLDVLPATVIVDQRGQFVAIFAGVPTVSDLAILIAR